MERNAINEVSESSLPPPFQTIAVAINGNRKSKYIVKWALDTFSSEENTIFKLLHVRPTITSVPTPMGNFLPISQVREDVVDAYKQEVEWKISEMLLPYKEMFVQKKVQVDVLNIEADDVARAIAKEVGVGCVNKLVIGASSRGLFTRKLNGRNFSSKVSESIPIFCTVYTVSKGKLSSVRQSDLETNRSARDDVSDTCFSNSSLSNTSSLRADQGSVISYSHFRSSSLPMQRFEALSTINQTLLNSRVDSLEINHSRSQSVDFIEGEAFLTSCPSNSNSGSLLSRFSSCRTLMADDQLWISDHASTSEAATDSSSESQANMNFELEKLRIELRHIRGMYAVAQTETLDASRKVKNLNKRRLEEAVKLKEIKYKEEMAKELVKQEKEKYEDAKREADHLWECAQREALQRKEAEAKASHDDREKEELKNSLLGLGQQYKKFTWDEIVNATSSFSENLIIGKGSYGTVYKCSLHHTTAAVKVLHSRERQCTKQFQQELEILTRIRHPHLLLLIGACPDQGCLVYEYMENGSLEERLLRRNNKTPPIPWFDRFRIAWEIASALVFLHNSKPKPIIHRDLKPANILLDRNLVSKIGDVGLSKMLHSVDTSSMSMYNGTGLVGSLCYIDPEYQRTGLNSPKSDVYALGMILLQLLTAKSAIALTHMVETALTDGHILKVLDPDAGQWPIEEAKELAVLGLSCAELRRTDRPDLTDHVLPMLERLRAVANTARDSANKSSSAPPNHFFCPILKEVMRDPCVASDGYTYDRQSIEAWLDANDKSPMTNATLPSKNLIPNYTLLSAILEWKCEAMAL